MLQGTEGRKAVLIGKSLKWCTMIQRPFVIFGGNMSMKCRKMWQCGIALFSFFRFSYKQKLRLAKGRILIT